MRNKDFGNKLVKEALKYVIIKYYKLFKIQEMDHARKYQVNI